MLDSGRSLTQCMVVRSSFDVKVSTRLRMLQVENAGAEHECASCVIQGCCCVVLLGLRKRKDRARRV